MSKSEQNATTSKVVATGVNTVKTAQVDINIKVSQADQKVAVIIEFNNSRSNGKDKLMLILILFGAITCLAIGVLLGIRR